MSWRVRGRLRLIAFIAQQAVIRRVLGQALNLDAFQSESSQRKWKIEKSSA